MAHPHHISKLRDRIAAAPVWVGVVATLALALLLEVFLFNFRFWQSLGYDEVVLRDNPITVRKADYSLGFNNLDIDVKNIKIVTSGPEDNSDVWLTVSVSDDGESKSYDLPVIQSHSDNARSEVTALFTYGHVHSLRVTVPGDANTGVSNEVLLGSNSLPLTIQSISLNAHVPFNFSWLRVVLAFGILLILFFLWPGRSLSRIPALSPRMGASLARTGVLVGVLVLLVLFWFSIPRWIGFATASYNSSAYDEDKGGLVQLTGQPDTATNEYGKLAQAFTKGQLNLLQEPPDWLVQMDDPYMYGARNAESSNHLRGYLWDTAYYNGHYYVYFGVLPVLVFYLPYFVLTNKYLPNSIPVIIASLFFVVGWYSLLRAMVQYKFKRLNLANFFLIFLGGLFCAGLIFGIGRAGLYNVPVTCGRALAIWGLCLWYRGWHKRSPGRLAGGSLLMACIAATRPQLLILMPLLFVLLYFTVRDRGLVRRQKVSWCACLLVPVVVVAAGVMWYNYARFGSVADFGQNYNLTYNNMTMRGTSFYRMVEGLYYSLFNPPTIVSSFPFIQHAAIQPGFPGKTIYEPLIGGLLWLNPMLIVLFLMGTLRHGGPDGKGDRRLFWMVAYLTAAAVILVMFDSNGAGILLRYFQDFGFIFGLAACLVFLYHLGGIGAKLPEGDAVVFEAINAAGGKLDTVEKSKKKDEKKSEEVDAQSVSEDVAIEAADATAAADSDSTVAATASAAADVTAKIPADATAEIKPKRSPWAVALFVCVLIGLVMTILSVLFMQNPVEGGVSAGGTYPDFWETMRQTFMWWL